MNTKWMNLGYYLPCISQHSAQGSSKHSTQTKLHSLVISMVSLCESSVWRWHVHSHFWSNTYFLVGPHSNSDSLTDVFAVMNVPIWTTSLWTCAFCFHVFFFLFCHKVGHDDHCSGEIQTPCNWYWDRKNLAGAEEHAQELGTFSKWAILQIF